MEKRKSVYGFKAEGGLNYGLQKKPDNFKNTYRNKSIAIENMAFFVFLINCQIMSIKIFIMQNFHFKYFLKQQR